MKDSEAIEMMIRTREEILSLRRVIAELTPKADAYDQMRKVLNLLPRPSCGMGEDYAWRLEKRIEELRKAAAPDVDKVADNE